jgi:transcriptional regulator with XRE-family HTH domain
MPASPNSPKQLELLETARKKRVALERRLKKVSYRAIADELDVSVGTVTNWVKEMTVTMLPQEDLEQLRAQEVAGYDESERRMEYLISMIAETIVERKADGQPYGHQLEQLAGFEDRIATVRKQRALLLGLNAPVSVKHAHTVRTEFDAEVEGLVSDLLGGGHVLTQPDEVDTGDLEDAV